MSTAGSMDGQRRIKRRLAACVGGSQVGTAAGDVQGAGQGGGRIAVFSGGRWRDAGEQGGAVGERGGWRGRRRGLASCMHIQGEDGVKT